MTRESAWAEASELVRQRWGLAPGDRWDSRQWRDVIDHFDRLCARVGSQHRAPRNGSPEALNLQSKWTECPRCAGSGNVNSVPLGEISSANGDLYGTRCVDCAGVGWVESAVPRPLSVKLAWEIAWLGGIRRAESALKRSRGRPGLMNLIPTGEVWSVTNWELTVWEFWRIGAATLPEVDWCARVLDVAERLGLGLAELRGLSASGWEILARQAGIHRKLIAKEREQVLWAVPLRWRE